MTKAAYFPPDALKFLADLRKHNDREWFSTHADRFERSLRDPFERFLADLGPRVEKLSAPFVVDANRKSLARIHRDMRFTKDAAPYKTALSAHIEHMKARPGAVPSFFLYLEPGKSTLGAGIRQPDPLAWRKIKGAIAQDTPAWIRASKGKQIDVKRDDLVLHIPFSDDDVSSVHFLDDVARGCKTLLPFVAYLSRALGLKT